MCRTTEQTPRAETDSSGQPESSRATVEQEVETARDSDRGATNETRSSSTVLAELDNRKRASAKEQLPPADGNGIYGYGRRGTNSDRFGDSLSSLGSNKSTSRNGSSGPMTLTMADLRVREQLAEFLALDEDESTCSASTGFGLSEGGGGGGGGGGVGLLPRRISRDKLATAGDSGGSGCLLRPGRRFSEQQRRGSVGSASLVEASAIVAEGRDEDISDDEDDEDDSVRANTNNAK